MIFNIYLTKFLERWDLISVYDPLGCIYEIKEIDKQERLIYTYSIKDGFCTPKITKLKD